MRWSKTLLQVRQRRSMVLGASFRLGLQCPASSLGLRSPSAARRRSSPATPGNPRCSRPASVHSRLSSMPLTSSGAVSKRTWMSRREGFVERALDRRRCSAGRSNALRTSAGSDAALSALASPLFAWPSSSRKRRTNTSTMRSSRLAPARSASALRAMANTSCCVAAADAPGSGSALVAQRFLPFGAQGLGGLPRLVEQPLALGFRLVRRLAQQRGALLRRIPRSCAGTRRAPFGASAFFASASASSAAMRFSRASMASRIGPVQEALQQPHQDEEVERPARRR